MMEKIGPLRGQARPSRILIETTHSGNSVYYQVISPLEIETICRGRLVEEIPRIISMLGPCHHIASAMVLDQLYEVKLPSTAVNIRKAFLCADRFSHHLTKFFFLSNFAIDRFERYPYLATLKLLNYWKKVRGDIIRTRGLSKEAAAILAGRWWHPIFCVAGGISQPLKDSHVDRLKTIAEQCSKFAEEFSRFFHEAVIDRPEQWTTLFDVRVPDVYPLAVVDADNVHVVNQQKRVKKLSISQALEAIALRRYSWSHEPVAYLKNRRQTGIETNMSNSSFFVGPLARFLARKCECAREVGSEREFLKEFLDSREEIPVVVGYWVLLAELIEAGKEMQELFTEKSLLDSDIRNLPVRRGISGYAAIEGPEGLVFHQYQIDPNGIVEDMKVVYPLRTNIIFRSLIARNVINKAEILSGVNQSLKEAIEISLIPF